MEYTVEQIKEMNIYEKMSNTRLFMQEEGIKKLGKNTFAKYDYYKLADINTVMNKGLQKFRLFTQIEVQTQIAILEIVNVDNPQEKVMYSMPFIEAEMKSASKIQSWGSSVSYLSRYLILEAFQIGEAEVDVDSTEESVARAEVSQQPNKSSLKDEVVALCREKAGENRAAVNTIIKKYNNNSIAVSKIEDEEVLKQIKEEVEKL